MFSGEKEHRLKIHFLSLHFCIVHIPMVLYDFCTAVVTNFSRGRTQLSDFLG